MTRNRLATAALLGATALLLVPATGSAQMMLPGRLGGWGGGYGYSPGYYSYGYSPGYYNYGYAPYRSGYYGGTWAYPGSSWGGYTYSYPRYGYPYSTYFPSNDVYRPLTTYSGSYAPAEAGSYYSYGAPASTAERDTVLLNVRLPDANADVWVEGKRTQQRGTLREYQSPPLDPNRNYAYEVRARWTENGKEVERTKTVPVRANGTATVDFTASAGGSRVDDVTRPEKP